MKWYKGNTLLTSSPPYRIEYGEYSTLIIDNVDKNRDEGDYKCFAKNFLGNDEATGKATVLGESIMMCRFDTSRFADTNSSSEIAPKFCSLQV